MCATSPLPHLFGRFTTVMREHVDLAATLGAAREMCILIEMELHPLPPRLVPAVVIARLRAELANHFALEEGHAYFGTVVDEAPALSGPIEALKEEHALMLAQLRSLADLADDSARWSALLSETRGFLQALERHEKAESALLRELFFPSKL